MNCQQTLDLVPEALDETLTESTRREFLGHLSACGACRNYVEQLRLSVQALKRVPTQGKPNPRRAELIEAFRKKFR